jgi:aldose 1-epimerase
MRKGTVLCVLTLLAVAGLSGAKAEEKGKAKTGVVMVPFGTTSDGNKVELYVLTNTNGMTVKIMTLGAAITELWVPDRTGKLADVNLAFEDVKGYQSKSNPFFGCIVGRVCNRIAKGRFTLDGKEYKLVTNNGPNHLHGGTKGFDKALWTAKIVDRDKVPAAVSFQYTSPDGEEGYPGALRVGVVYELSDKNELKIHYTAGTDKPTPVNLTNHAYLNLAGHNAGDILDHELTIKASNYTPTDDTLIPTGKIESVKGTPFDFTTPHTIGERIGKIKANPIGYDLNYVLDSGGSKDPVLAATVHEPKSGRVLEVLTTEPGVQFYTGNFLDGSAKGKGGAVYKKHAGFCLETQHFPDSVNQPKFPSVILQPKETYQTTTVFRFSAK